MDPPELAGCDAWSDLSPSILFSIFNVLDAYSLAQAAQCCRHWSETGRDERLWRNCAEKRWPKQTLDIGAYGTYKALVLDHNRDNAVEAIDISRISCFWRLNCPSRYYQCKLVSLECNRHHRYIRLYLDSRGEIDLRHPATSSLAVVQVPQGTDRSRVGDCTSWSQLYGAFFPDSFLTISSQPGHYKVGLQWQESQFAALVSLLDCGGRSLVFCYANHLATTGPGDYSAYWPDYTAAHLLAVERGSCFAETWRNMHQYQGIGEIPLRLHAETSEEEEQRWTDLPGVVRRRGSDWWKKPVVTQSGNAGLVWEQV